MYAALVLEARARAACGYGNDGKFLTHPGLLCRQQRELADVEMSRLTALLEASKAAAAAATGQAGDAERAAQQRLHTVLAQRVQVRSLRCWAYTR